VIGIVAAELVARGHDVRIFAQPHRKPTLHARLSTLLKKREVRRMPKDGPFMDSVLDRITTLETNRPVTDADLPDADVVVATWWETAPWVNALSAQKGAKAYFMQDYGAPSQEIEKLVPTWKMPFTFITLTAQLRGQIKAHNPDAAVAIMRNAVDHSLFNAPPRTRNSQPTIGLLFRQQSTKGMDIAAKALAQIRRDIPNLRALIVKCGTDGFPDWVEHIHSATDAKLAQLYRSCDLWFFPSRMEGFGLPIIEAMASRTPVISTRVGCAEDVITDGVSGHLVAIEDWQAMAEIAVDLLSGPLEKWTAMSQAAHDAVADHTWSDAVDVFEKSLLQACASNSKPE
jgi:glycosyltransferase involved in cell wall biosynthesis